MYQMALLIQRTTQVNVFQEIGGNLFLKVTGQTLCHVSRSGYNNYTLQAKELQERFEQYFTSQNGPVPWKYKHVRSCGPIFTL